jgi:hypothetical protein
MHDLIRGFGLWGPIEQLLLNMHPALLMCLGFTPLALTLGAVMLVELRPPELNKQYLGIWPGDLFLGAGIGFPLIALPHHSYYSLGEVGWFWRSGWWNAATIVMMAGVVLALAVPEYVSAIKYPYKAWSYTLYQLHTPSCLAHRVSMAFIPLVLMKVVLPLLAFAALAIELKAGWLAGMIAWACCAMWLDNRRMRPNLLIIHPLSRAWFRLF